MSSSKLIVVTGQLPMVQSQVVAMLSDQFACCSVPLADGDTLNKISKLAEVLVLLLDEEALSSFPQLPALRKIPTLAILNQPSSKLLQQVYQSGVNKILFWPNSKDELSTSIRACIPPKTWQKFWKNTIDAFLHPVLSVQKIPFPQSKKEEEPVYHISLLGELSVRCGTLQMRPHTHREQELLGYLLFNYPQPVRREKLCAALWPGIDSESARNRLNVLIHRLRKGSGKEQSVADWLVFDTRLNAYSLNIPDPVQIDLQVHHELLSELKNQQHHAETCIQICKKIVELHQGEFLEGIDNAEWVDRYRLDLREKLQAILLRLVDYFLLNKVYAQAIYFCRRGVDLDPCVEAMQQRLVLAYALNGDRTAAIRAYRRFEQTRMQEFTLAPSASSKALLELVEEGSHEHLYSWFNHLNSKN